MKHHLFAYLNAVLPYFVALLMTRDAEFAMWLGTVSLLAVVYRKICEGE